MRQKLRICYSPTNKFWIIKYEKPHHECDSIFNTFMMRLFKDQMNSKYNN